jgi:hypothetical protein
MARGVDGHHVAADDPVLGFAGVRRDRDVG